MKTFKFNAKEAGVPTLWVAKGRKLVASTGPSALATVLERMTVFGNQNGQTGKALHWKHIVERYEVPIRRAPRSRARRVFDYSTGEVG